MAFIPTSVQDYKNRLKKISVGISKEGKNGTQYANWISRIGSNITTFNLWDNPSHIESVSGLILTGGSDLGKMKDRDDHEFKMLEIAISRGIPVFGICRGLQLINESRGGSLINDIPTDRPSSVNHGQETGSAEVHPLSILSDTILSKITNGMKATTVNSFHHQAIDVLGEDLIISSVAPDGIIESIEGTSQDHFLMAVQWHPEIVRDGNIVVSAHLASTFASMCRRYSFT